MFLCGIVDGVSPGCLSYEIVKRILQEINERNLCFIVENLVLQLCLCCSVIHVTDLTTLNTADCCCITHSI